MRTSNSLCGCRITQRFQHVRASSKVAGAVTHGSFHTIGKRMSGCVHLASGRSLIWNASKGANVAAAQICPPGVNPMIDPSTNVAA